MLIGLNFQLGCSRRKRRGIVIAWRRRRRRRAKTSTFTNISVITEDIYLKLRVAVHYQKGNSYSRGGNPPFFDKNMPLFRLRIFKMQLQPSVGTRMRCSCSYFSLKPYVVTLQRNRLFETVQLRDHSICFMQN